MKSAHRRTCSQSLTQSTAAQTLNFLSLSLKSKSQLQQLIAKSQQQAKQKVTQIETLYIENIPYENVIDLIFGKCKGHSIEKVKTKSSQNELNVIPEQKIKNRELNKVLLRTHATSDTKCGFLSDREKESPVKSNTITKSKKSPKLSNKTSSKSNKSKKRKKYSSKFKQQPSKKFQMLMEYLHAFRKYPS